MKSSLGSLVICLSSPLRSVEHPDVVVAAERVAAIGRERDAGAVVRVDRLAIVERAPRQLALVRAVGIDGPEVVAAVAIREEDDGAAVRRPHRLARIVEDVGDALHRAAGGRHRPDAALHVGGERAAVRRDRHRHRRAFAHGDVDLRRRGGAAARAGAGRGCDPCCAASPATIGGSRSNEVARHAANLTSERLQRW